MYKIMTPGPTQVAENVRLARSRECTNPCLLYTSDAADDLLTV